MYRDAKGKLMPYAQYTNVLSEIKEAHNAGRDWAGTQTLVMPEGRETFRLLTENKLELIAI